MSVTALEFRQALSHFASGVTVVTTRYQGQLHGTTVSAFCSLSLTPPQILIGIDRKAAIHNLILESGIFGVNILAEQAESLSRQFARQSADKFAGIDYHLGQTGVPLLAGALTTLECRLVAHHDGGDHSIFIGEVVATAIQEYQQPLLYFRSKYHHLHQSAAELVSNSQH